MFSCFSTSRNIVSRSKFYWWKLKKTLRCAHLLPSLEKSGREHLGTLCRWQVIGTFIIVVVSTLRPICAGLSLAKKKPAAIGAATSVKLPGCCSVWNISQKFAASFGAKIDKIVSPLVQPAIAVRKECRCASIVFFYQQNQPHVFCFVLWLEFFD